MIKQFLPNLSTSDETVSQMFDADDYIQRTLSYTPFYRHNHEKRPFM